MINLYWPGKQIPEWLSQVTLDGKDGNGQAIHRGFGLIVNRRGRFYAWQITGHFMWIRGKHHISVDIKTGGKGVLVCFTLRAFIREMRAA